MKNSIETKMFDGIKYSRMEDIIDTVAAMVDGGILKLTSLKHKRTKSY